MEFGEEVGFECLRMFVEEQEEAYEFGIVSPNPSAMIESKIV